MHNGIDAWAYVRLYYTREYAYDKQNAERADEIYFNNLCVSEIFSDQILSVALYNVAIFQHFLFL